MYLRQILLEQDWKIATKLVTSVSVLLDVHALAEEDPEVSLVVAKVALASLLESGQGGEPAVRVRQQLTDYIEAAARVCAERKAAEKALALKLEKLTRVLQRNKGCISAARLGLAVLAEPVKESN